MQQTEYLIVGASHAALAAVQAIRMHDQTGSVTVVSKDDALPYSPTVLPYVVSGRSDPQNVFLRDDAYFSQHNVDYRKGAALAALHAGDNRVRLTSGAEISYQKLLLATGAAPQLPPVPGLDSIDYHVLRSLDDAVRLQQALAGSRQAIVLGAGLVGMHAAENLAKAGVQVTVVEMQPTVLAGYFDSAATAIIESVFAAKGVCLMMGNKVVRLSPNPNGKGAQVTLANGAELVADLLLVSTGVAPVIDFLTGTGVTTGRGILVDDTMRTTVDNIWAAGDVAQARGFYDAGAKVINGILPDAVEQGKIAGMAMAGDPALKHYPGGVPLNTYSFFGQQAVSVGSQSEGEVALQEVDAARNSYLKIVMQDGRLTGIFGINVAFDPGVMWELILRRIDLTPLREKFLAAPQRTARHLMSSTWR
ncbi:NADH-dependent phenylglyoxylate dehydrogenase subunit epsilon [Herminiimonas sp. CN]|uniref:NADH-dependent phenylglyoxylate dehydrogenase subunit epsilon n=1 Tax=Herminiimonas sp. CN TaxID=1349818 RepID=UPI000473D3AA|nr:NAD(P)/FAD-dependent oxidoreductase [Herminiimonas sp. CN]